MLSYEEMVFFSQFLDKPIEEINCLKIYTGDASWEPLWEDLRVHNINGQKYEIVIQRDSNGTCPFLHADGCMLKRRKPLICNLYPFWPMNGKVEYDKDPHDKICPIIQTMSVEEALQHLGVSEAQIFEWKEEFINDAISFKKELTELAQKLFQKQLKEITSKKTCIDCPSHEVLSDPDPYDWFCDDDVNVVCKKNGKNITVACRPYQIRKECEIPEWCPINIKRA
jgi:Fe-S-cluster containining protein